MTRPTPSPLPAPLTAPFSAPTPFDARLAALAAAYLDHPVDLRDPAARDAFQGHLLELVAEGQTTGHLRPGDPRALATPLWAALHGAAALAAAGAADRAAMAGSFAALLPALSRPGGPAAPREPPRGEAVLVVLRRRDGRYLLVRRAAALPGGDFWTPVSGRPEPGESLTAAAAREVREEVGLAAAIGPELQRGLTADGGYRLVWLAATLRDPDDAPLTPDPAEVAAAGWFSPAEALALRPLFPATRAFFAALPDSGP